jgi:UDP-N-acetyl-D-mannosaminuronic acid dehydrogenase
MKVGIIGLGYVGLTLGVALAKRGLKIYGIEINISIRNSLLSGKAHFEEEGLNVVFKKVVSSGAFSVVDSFNSIDLDACIITVGTPLDEDRNLNFDSILQSLEHIPLNTKDGFLVILRSTVATGTTRNLIAPWLSKERGVDLVAFCPERTIEGDALEELSTLPQIIGGIDAASRVSAVKLFRCLTDKIVEVDDLETAELAKLFNNTYRDLNFALGNYFALVAQKFNVDGIAAIKAANQDYKRGGIPLPGFVGGPCLEKDPYILANDAYAFNNIPALQEFNFTALGRSFNESFINRVLEYSSKFFVLNKILVSGVAFKGIPKTSDLRGSLALKLVDRLVNKGYEVEVHDFEAFESEILIANPNVTFVKNLSQSKSNYLIVGNNHINYRTLVLDDLNRFDLIFDVWDNFQSIGEIKHKTKTFGNFYL